MRSCDARLRSPRPPRSPLSAALIGSLRSRSAAASYTPVARRRPVRTARVARTRRVAETLEQIALSTADGAACTLGVPREDLVLALGSRRRPRPLRHEARLSHDDAERAIRDGLVRAVDDAEQADAIGGGSPARCAASRATCRSGSCSTSSTGVSSLHPRLRIGAEPAVQCRRRGRSSVGRASASQAVGRGFESLRPLWFQAHFLSGAGKSCPEHAQNDFVRVWPCSWIWIRGIRKAARHRVAPRTPCVRAHTSRPTGVEQDA